MNKIILKHEKERKAKLIEKLEFQIQLSEEIKQNRNWFKRS